MQIQQKFNKIKASITIVCLIITFVVIAQKRDNYGWKQAATVATAFTAGWFHGTNEVSVHDYRRFAARHPFQNEQWSNPKISFKNKYKDWPVDKSPAYFGSKTILVWTTDAYHLRSTVRNMLMAGSLGFSMSLYEKPCWKAILLQCAISWASYAAGTGAAHAFYKPID